MPDIIGVLNEQDDYTRKRNYWKYLKAKLKKESNEVVSATSQLKLHAPDGKMRLTDVLDAAGEVDFVCTKTGETAYVQVTFLMGEQTTDENGIKHISLREFLTKGLKTFSDEINGRFGKRLRPEKPTDSEIL